jgi:hypothetical protein
MNIVVYFFRYVGFLRALLVILTVAVIACAPLADGKVHLGWMLVPTLVAPTLMAMLAFSLPLDMTMTRVFMLDTAGDERRRYRHIFWLEALLFVTLLAVWTPFLLRLLGK